MNFPCCLLMFVIGSLLILPHTYSIFAEVLLHLHFSTAYSQPILSGNCTLNL